MGLITGILTLPLAPVRGTVWIAEQIRQQAEEELYDPSRIHDQRAELDQARESGALSEEEAAQLEEELIERLMVAQSRPRRKG